MGLTEQYWRTRNQTNGQPYTIEALNPDNTIEIRTKGQRYTVTANQLLHSDYAYCRTVYSAQGWTSAEAIWAPQQNPGREQTYVALTRAKESLQILTLNRAALGLSAQTTQRQENALDLIESIPPSTQVLTPEPASTQPTETQQLSLFPGMTDDLKRKVKPKSTRSELTQRSDRPSPNPAAAPEHRNDPSQTQQTSRQQGQAEPTRATDGIGDIAPVRSRFADIEERARALSEQLEHSRRKPEHPQQPDGADAGIDSNPAPDLRELHLEPQPAHPTQSEPRNPTAAINPGNSDTQTTEPAVHPADEPRLEPDQSLHPQTSEPLEPDSSEIERSATQHQNRLDHLYERDRRDESIEYGISESISERSIQPTVRADEWEAEQSGDPDAQAAQALEVEDPQVEQIQRHLEIAQNWSDNELLSIASAVEDYFKAPPPKPDVKLAQQLQTDLKQMRTQYYQIQSLIREQRETLKDLEPARSWKYFLGSNPREVEAAEQRLEQIQGQSMMVASRIHKTEAAFASWQEEVRTYVEWEGSEKGQQMHQCRAIVQLEPVQHRITQIHQAQEQIRQVQESARKMQERLKILQEWKQTAIKLGRSNDYVHRIQEITEDYKQGKPLNEKQIECMRQDLADYQESMRQVRSSRMGGLGR